MSCSVFCVIQGVLGSMVDGLKAVLAAVLICSTRMAVAWLMSRAWLVSALTNGGCVEVFAQLTT